MGDEFDGCECVWTHELAMRRLLSMMRQGQTSCTDTECLDVSNRLPGAIAPSPTGTEDTNFTMMTMLMIFAMILYFIRPDSIMKFTNTKRSTDQRPGQDPNDGAPQPPPPAAY